MLRPWFLATALAIAAAIAWFTWPSNSGISAVDLSQADGKSRFVASTDPWLVAPDNLSLPQRLLWPWTRYKLRHRKPTLAAYTFPVSEVRPTTIGMLLNQCTEVTLTRYFIAVEIAGAPIEFGTTNVLTGTQWVAAAEHAIEASPAVVCFDFRTKSDFRDTILLIREAPGVVKVVPKSKLADYQRAGLLKTHPQ